MFRGTTAIIEVNKAPPTWASRAVAIAIDDASWEPLLESLHTGIRAQLKQLAVGKRFSELTVGEQAALVERSFYETQQNEVDAERVARFSQRLGRAVDDELLAFLQGAAQAGGAALPSLGEREAQGGLRLSEHVSNADQMLEVFAKTVLEMLDASPPEMASTLRLFLNRPLPECLRGSIWLSALTKRIEPQKNRRGSMSQPAAPAHATQQLQPPPGLQVVVGKLAPSLDVLLARRCHAMLDACFGELSSRANASFLKQVVSTFMRMLGLKVGHTLVETHICTHIYVHIHSYRHAHAGPQGGSHVPVQGALSLTLRSSRLYPLHLPPIPYISRLFPTSPAYPLHLPPIPYISRLISPTSLVYLPYISRLY